MSLTIWASFIGLIILFLVLDLGVFHKKNTVMCYKEAMTWSAIWIFTALLFGLVVYLIYAGHVMIDVGSSSYGTNGSTALIQYYTGYLIEKSLSLDNIFVIALIFQFFKIPNEYQHRVLFWGIIGAIVLRAIMIIFGVALVNQFEWLIYVFGAFLIYTSIKMFIHRNAEQHPENNFLVRFLSKKIRLTNDLSSGHFFIKKDGLKYATPLFLALVVIETSDVIFAVDSIPAIFAVTLDPFIIFTSNIFAILGLRSLYFVLAALMDKFSCLKYSLIAILFYVGVKMIIVDFIHIPAWVSLIMISLFLFMGVFFSSKVKCDA